MHHQTYFSHSSLSGTRLLLAMVLAQIQEVKDVRVPGLDVDCKRALALAAALVHIPVGFNRLALRHSAKVVACGGCKCRATVAQSKARSQQ